MEKENITGFPGKLINLFPDFLINENLSFRFTVYYAIINYVLTTFACKRFKARTMHIKKKIFKVNHNFYFFNYSNNI